jgi:hypothetical protein
LAWCAFEKIEIHTTEKNLSASSADAGDAELAIIISQLLVVARAPPSLPLFIAVVGSWDLDNCDIGQSARHVHGSSVAQSQNQYG